MVQGIPNLTSIIVVLEAVRDTASVKLLQTCAFQYLVRSL